MMPDMNTLHPEDVMMTAGSRWCCFLKPKRGTPCSSLSTDIYSFCSHLTGCWTSLSVSVYFGLICVCFVCCSCPEDRGHQEETAVVHRALQVTPQLPESLVCLRHTSVSRPHQPGQRSHRVTFALHWFTVIT